MSSGVIILDLSCINLTRATLGHFILSVLHAARAGGATVIQRVIALVDANNNSLLKDIENDLNSFGVDLVNIRTTWISLPQYRCSCGLIHSSAEELGHHDSLVHKSLTHAVPSVSYAEKQDSNHTLSLLSPSDVSALLTRIPDMPPNSLITLVTSSPHMFTPIINQWKIHSYRLLIIHGNEKKVHSLPIAQMPYLRPQLQSIGEQVQQSLITLSTDHSYDGLSQLPPSLQSSLTLSYRLVRSVEKMAALCAQVPSLYSSYPDASPIDHSMLVGVVSFYELPVWWDLYEQPLSSSSLLPRSSCPQWNAHLKCPYQPCIQPHVCQSCGSAAHRLSDCIINSYYPIPYLHSTDILGKPDSSSQRSVIPPQFLLSYYPAYLSLLKVQSAHFDNNRWRLPLLEQVEKYGTFTTPSVLLTAPITPCDSIIYVDWQNVHVPIAQIENFISGIRNAVLPRPGVARIKAFNFLIDKYKQKEVKLAIEKFHSNSNIQIVHVDATKKNQIDAKLTSMLRTEPSKANYGIVAGHSFPTAAVSSPFPQGTPQSGIATPSAYSSPAAVITSSVISSTSSGTVSGYSTPLSSSSPGPGPSIISADSHSSTSSGTLSSSYYYASTNLSSSSQSRALTSLHSDRMSTADTSSYIGNPAQLMLNPNFLSRTRESDLVCLVSGDIDFSPDLCQLVQRGNRVMVILNTQARYGMKVRISV